MGTKKKQMHQMPQIQILKAEYILIHLLLN